jgi:fructosamine-3-kinase
VSLADAVLAATGRTVRSAARVAGGDINDAYRVELDGGTRAFVKTRADAAPGEYAAEAAGLRWLAEPAALPLPGVFGASDAVLVLEWIDEGPPGDESSFGAGLAAIHAAGAPAFGATPSAGGDRAPGGARAAGGDPAAAGDRPAGGDLAAGGDLRPLRIGRLVLPNERAADWATFYARNRLLPLLGEVPAPTARVVERVCERLGELAGPPEPPARLHGDLWSGNVLWAASGRPYLIDPAAYGGHREVDLAMLRLFGSPGPAFLAAYEERRPLSAGHEERVALWQLFPLLVHAALFGGGYALAAEQAARRYA